MQFISKLIDELKNSAIEVVKKGKIKKEIQIVLIIIKIE